MEKKNKELLLKDLCARLPYGVKVKVFNEDVWHDESFVNTFASFLSEAISTMEE